MEGKISRCFISLLLSLLAILPLAAQQNYYGQGRDTRPVATKTEKGDLPPVQRHFHQYRLVGAGKQIVGE